MLAGGSPRWRAPCALQRVDRRQPLADTNTELAIRITESSPGWKHDLPYKYPHLAWSAVIRCGGGAGLHFCAGPHRIDDPLHGHRFT